MPSTPRQLNPARADSGACETDPEPLFARTFGATRGAFRAFAPGRVNLIGAHVDYNDGPVLPMPLDLGTHVVLRLSADRRARLVSAREGSAGPFDLDDVRPAGADLGWEAYPLGVAAMLAQDGVDVPGFDVAVAGDLAVGAGLSSSASILVAMARAFDQALGLGLTPEEHARLAYRAETTFVGVACGIMDPYACAVARPGSALWLDCRDRTFQHVPLDRDRLGVLIVDSATRRALKDSQFNDRVAACRTAVEGLRAVLPSIRSLRDVTETQLDEHEHCLDPVVRRRARHVVAEIARVGRFREALARGDIEACGRLVTESHVSTRDLYETSTKQLDALVAEATHCAEVFGARLTGAGFGGCVLVLCRRGAEASVAERMIRAYGASSGQDARFHVVA